VGNFSYKLYRLFLSLHSFNVTLFTLGFGLFFILLQINITSVFSSPIMSLALAFSIHNKQPVVYYESIKRELKIRPIYECRCDERLKTKPTLPSGSGTLISKPSEVSGTLPSGSGTLRSKPSELSGTLPSESGRHNSKPNDQGLQYAHHQRNLNVSRTLVARYKFVCLL